MGVYCIRSETFDAAQLEVFEGLRTHTYNKFVGSFERNVLSAGRRLSEKGIEIGKREIEEIPQIAETPTYTSEDVAALEDDDAGKSIEDARDAAE